MPSDLCLIVVFFSAVSSGGIASATSFFTVPRSSVVKIGDGVELKCSAMKDVSVIWQFIGLNSSAETTVYLVDQIPELMRSRYMVDKNISGQYDLIIDSVDLNHAGSYRCDAFGSRDEASAQLTVLDSSPHCSSNISSEVENITEDSYLWMWCRISYAGNMISVFKWTKYNTKSVNGTSREPLTTTSTAQHQEYSDNISRELLTTTSSVIVQVNSNDNGATFRCQITFQLPNNTEASPPEYEYTWNYTADVKYEPMNLSIASNDTHLSCSADGNPTPTYWWSDADTNITITRGHVSKLNGTYDKDRTFRCTATNAFGNKTKDITVSARARDQGETKDVSDIPITGPAIGGSLLFLLTIIIIVSCTVHRKRLKDNTRDRPDVALHTDPNPYDEIMLSSDRSSNIIMEEDRLPGGANGRTMIADNVVYSEVRKPKGGSNGIIGDNHGENSRPIPTQRKNLIGADGTVYSELSQVKPPARKGEVPKPPAFSRVGAYASIDHNGRAPPPPPKL